MRESAETEKNGVRSTEPRTVNAADDHQLQDRKPDNHAKWDRLEEGDMRLRVHLVPPPRVGQQQQRPLPQLAARQRLERPDSRTTNERMIG